MLGMKEVNHLNGAPFKQDDGSDGQKMRDVFNTAAPASHRAVESLDESNRQLTATESLQQPPPEETQRHQGPENTVARPSPAPVSIPQPLPPPTLSAAHPQPPVRLKLKPLPPPSSTASIEPSVASSSTPVNSSSAPLRLKLKPLPPPPPTQPPSHPPSSSSSSGPAFKLKFKIKPPPPPPE